MIFIIDNDNLAKFVSKLELKYIFSKIDRVLQWSNLAVVSKLKMKTICNYQIFMVFISEHDYF